MRYRDVDNDGRSTGCGCRRCRREYHVVDRLAEASLSAALSHAQDRAESDWSFEAATTRQRIGLPGEFGGWMNPTALEVVLSPQAPAPFTLRNTKSLYRIYEVGRQIPLYIGMAFREPIQDRVLSHVRGIFTKSGALAKTAQVAKLAQGSFADKKSEIEKFRILASQPGMSNRIKVQYASVKPDQGYALDPKLLHAFEAALQVREKPRSYVGTARTFELEFD